MNNVRTYRVLQPIIYCPYNYFLTKLKNSYMLLLWLLLLLFMMITFFIFVWPMNYI